MKNFKTHFRLKPSRTKKVYAPDGTYMYEVWATGETEGTVDSIEDFLKIFKPSKLSDGLMNAIKRAWDNNDHVIFNCGNGNQTFYFHEEK